MKKIVAVFVSVCLSLSLILMTAVSAPAFVVQIGDYRLIFDAYSIFDDIGPAIIPDFPGQTGTGNTWAIADLQSYQIDAGGGVWSTVWSRGQDGKYYHSVIGGLTLQPDTTPGPNRYRKVSHSGVHPQDVIPVTEYLDQPVTTFPHNSYMVDDIYDATSTGPGYLKMYEHTTDIWVAAVQAGPNIAGSGAFGTFGGAITTGTLVIDATFNPSALSASGDLDASFPGSPSIVSGATPGASVFRGVSNSATQVLLIGWGDVTGLGLWDSRIDTDTMHGGSDFRISVDIYSVYDVGPDGFAGTVDDIGWGPGIGNDPGGEDNWYQHNVGQIEGTAEEKIEGDCRVTAGGNKDELTIPCVVDPVDLLPESKTCVVDVSHTWGGQAGAQPGFDGNWTHHYKEDPHNNFGFHSNDLFCIVCSDPGPHCDPARPASHRQIDFAGIGKFTHKKGDVYGSYPEGDLCFEVHLEDIGEPGRGGKWPISVAKGLDCEHCPGTPIVNGDPEDLTSRSDCRDCTDYYEIKIYKTADRDGCGCAGGDENVLWVNGSLDTDRCGDPQLEGFFTRAGNVQMHPDNN